MGIFDKILNNITSKIKKEVMTKIDERFSSSSSSSSVSESSLKSENTVSETKQYSNNYNTDDSYFAQMITSEKFPGYTIEKSIHPRVFNSNAHEKCFPISYLFKKNDVPVLAVFIMKSNQYRAMIAVGSYEVLDENNIKYIRFFKGMKNEESYVLNRIKENLK